MTKTLKWLLVALVVVIIIGGGVTYWFMKGSKSNSVSPSTSPATSKTSSPSSSNLPVEASLLKASLNKNNFSIGYIKSNKVSNNWLPKALAEDKSTETPIFFYEMKKNNVPQIFYYNLQDNKENQLTNDESKSAVSPVFSSISQKLAYKQSPSSGDGYTCTTVIVDFTTREIIKEITGENCIRPLSWSPDGQKLAMMEYSQLKVYNFSTTDTKTYTTPNSNNLIYGVRWIDDQNIAGTYFSSDNKTPIPYKINLTSGLKPLQLTYPNPTKVEFSNNEIFYGTSTTIDIGPNGNLAKENIEGEKGATILEGTDRLYDYILALNEDGSAKTAIISQASPGAVISVNLSSKEVNKHKDLFNGTAFLIGWLNNYDQVLYTTNPGGSGATSLEIHLLNLKDNKDSVLFKTGGLAG